MSNATFSYLATYWPVSQEALVHWACQIPAHWDGMQAPKCVSFHPRAFPKGHLANCSWPVRFPEIFSGNIFGVAKIQNRLGTHPDMTCVFWYQVPCLSCRPPTSRILRHLDPAARNCQTFHHLRPEVFSTGFKMLTTWKVALKNKTRQGLESAGTIKTVPRKKKYLDLSFA